MGKYITRRLLTMIPLLIGISILSFTLLSLVPGDPVELLITSNPKVKPQDIARLKHIYGLDQPIYVRYIKWAQRLLSGDFGWSRTYKQPTLEILKQRIPNTLKLLVIAFIVSFFIAIPIGTYSATRQYSIFDYTINIFAFVGISIPVFWLGMMAILAFSVKLGWLPAGGTGVEEAGNFFGQLKSLILPSVILSVESIAGWSRYMRASMLETIRQDYIRTARAKGLSEKVVILKHAMRNAMIPIVTMLALSIPGLFSGALITETVFAWPGMGRLLYESVMGNDYYIAMISFMILSILTIVFNLLADITYGIVDPRIRQGGRKE